MANERREVVVTDVKISFWSMVVLMVKWAIAAIPAVIILIAIFALLGTVAGYVFGPGWHWYPWSKGTVTM